MTKLAKTAPALLIATLLAGCGGTNDYQPKAGTTPAQQFAEACQGCHGANGEGKFGFLLSVAGSEASAEKIAKHIAEGGPVMPAFPKIGEADRMAIAAYLKGAK